jgi:ribosome-associated translation inhibitor RaiA
LRTLPHTESLRDVTARLSPYWRDAVLPELAAGRTVLVVSHGNTLRAVCTPTVTLERKAMMQMSRVIRQEAESVLIEVTGPHTPEERHYAVEKFHALAAYAHRPLRRVHVTVVFSGNPGALHPVSLSVTVDLDGQCVHARAAGESMYECIDTVRQRLYGKLVRQRARRAGERATPPHRR